MKKVGSIESNGQIEIMYDEKAKVNPFKVYRSYWTSEWSYEMGNQWKKHRKMIARYDDMASCVYEIARRMQEGDWNDQR